MISGARGDYLESHSIIAPDHVILSIALLLAVVVVGLPFSKLISFYLSFVIGTAMLAIGLLGGIRSLVKRRHGREKER